MRIPTKVKLIAGGLVAVFSLSGCSTSAPVVETFVPPGSELGETVVAPPAELPPAREVPNESTVVEEQLACGVPQPIKPESIEILNNPLSDIERKTAAVKGEVIISASELPVYSSFQSTFSYLTKVNLDSGGVVWFGANGSLNNYEVTDAVVLTADGNASIFGATPETYESFIWGKNGPDSELVRDSTAVVEIYSKCWG